MKFPKALFPLVFVAMALVGCGKAKAPAAGATQLVSLSFGDTDAKVRAMTSNTFSATGLVVETIPVCGGTVQTIDNLSNPAAQIPVCKDLMATYPRLVKMQVQITGDGQAPRNYVLDFSKPDQIPSELSLTRTVSADTITYQLTDRGGAVQSGTNVVDVLYNAGLAVTYVDKHYIQSLSYTQPSETIIHATYDDCASCIADLSLSTFPTGISAKNNAAGSIDFDTSLALNGSYKVALAVKSDSSSTYSTIVNITLNVSRSQTLPAIEAVQVYQAGYNHGSTTWNGTTRGQAAITITAKRPIYLVLTAHEPVQWNLSGNVENVIGVFVYGYFSGAVTGISSSLVTSASVNPSINPISGADYAYGTAPGSVVLAESSATGYPIDTVQGAKDKTAFTVSGN